MTILEIDQLSITVNNKKIVHNSKLLIEEVGIYGLIGGRDAGKTLLFEWLSGQLAPLEGEIQITEKKQEQLLQASLVKIKPLLVNLTIFENLRVLCSNADSVSEADIVWYLSFVGLNQSDNRLVSALSKAEKYRLAIALSLIDNPSILLLDEPFFDFTIEDFNMIQHILSKIIESNIAIVIATRNEEGIRPLCKRVFRLAHGKLQ
ncbi:ATP-binding cassette domain-containing protein [Kurthia sibirica]|uniref:ABC transporter domain-containing protein n=1 Tax=Kurthia sibirica TaxID=202750 RepID=A0A2U3AR35_9BACL|nr:ATP-binding cassette domain-containing protein [Kurthia sibirica]PWI26984.1 hypothetical protein DEX24_01430 [Kurthia sibirica]GEK35614.1 ABC transporter ATP-binding protein [Kurthia sibirica]